MQKCPKLCCHGNILNPTSILIQNTISSFALFSKGQNTIRCACGKSKRSRIKFCYRDLTIFLSQLITTICVNYFDMTGTENVAMATKF